MFRILVLIIFVLLGYCKEKDRVLAPIGKPISGLALFIVGDVKTKLTPVKLGENIPESDEVSVGKKSLADFQILNIAEDIVIRLKEDTKFRLQEKITQDRPSKNLYIQSGEAIFNIKKLKQQESLIVVTPTIAIGVRGTQFGVSLDAKTGANKLTLYEGSVSVSPSLLELEELGEDIFQATGISAQVEDWKKKSELVIEPGQSIEVNANINKDFLKKLGWEEIKSKPEVKEFLSKKANSTLTEEDKNKVKLTLKSYYEDPKNKERVNSALNEKVSFSTRRVAEGELKSKLEELKELIAIEKEKLEISTDKTIPIKERAKTIRDQLLQRIADITGDDIRTIKLKNGQTLRGVISITGNQQIIVSTPEEVLTIPGDQFDDYVD